MKKLLALFLALCLVFLTVACDTPPDQGPDEGQTPNGGNQDPDEGDKEPDSGNKDPDDGDDVVYYAPTYAPVESGREAYTVEDDHGVLGEGIGVNPGRVVWERDTAAFQWDGAGYWCRSENFDEQAVRQMLADGLCSLAGTETEREAWDAIFRNFNWRVFGTDGTVDYAKGEKIAIKCNMNGLSPAKNPAVLNNQSFTSPVLLRALLLSLVEYGVEPEDITVFDASRIIPYYMQEYCGSGELQGVKFVYNGSDKGDRKDDAVADTERPIRWSAPVENYADEVYYPTCVTEADYLINISNLKPHTLAGFTASAKNHFGTVMVTSASEGSYINWRANPPTYAGLHPFAACMAWNGGHNWTFPQRPMGSYTVLTDLLSNADCGGKTLLYLMDAFAVSANQGAAVDLSSKWVSMNREWTSSIFLSQDPVALDSVSFDFITMEHEARKAVGDTSWDGCLPAGHTAQNYLHEAALAYDPPSGTYYQDGYGNLIPSLGVHEHWDNAESKSYSRNRGEDEGIELVQRLKK